MKILDMIIIATAVFIVLFSVYSIAGTVIVRRRLREEKYAVKLSRNMKPAKIALVCALISAALSAMMVYFDYTEIQEKKAELSTSLSFPSEEQTKRVEESREKQLKRTETHFKLRALLCLCWTMSAVLHAVEMKWGRYIYVTERGVYYTSGAFRTADKYRYTLGGDTLRLYFRKQKKPIAYGVIGDKDKLITMLTGNYEPFAAG